MLPRRHRAGRPLLTQLVMVPAGLLAGRGSCEDHAAAEILMRLTASHPCAFDATIDSATRVRSNCSRVMRVATVLCSETFCSGGLLCLTYPRQPQFVQPRRHECSCCLGLNDATSRPLSMFGGTIAAMPPEAPASHTLHGRPALPVFCRLQCALTCSCCWNWITKPAPVPQKPLICCWWWRRLTRPMLHPRLRRR